MKKDRDKLQKENAESFKMITLITQFGINMLVPIFICFYVGYLLDKFFGTGYFIIIFFFLGAFAGFRNIYILSKRMTKKSEEEAVTDSIVGDDTYEGTDKEK